MSLQSRYFTRPVLIVIACASMVSGCSVLTPRPVTPISEVIDLSRGSRPEQAIDRIAREPSAVEPRLALALLYLGDGRRDEAERALDAALKALRKQR